MRSPGNSTPIICNLYFDKNINCEPNARILFTGCDTLNCEIVLPDGVENCANMFEDCTNFNNPLDIPNNAINCCSMFRRCTNFNQPVTIPDNVEDCRVMFYGCTNFNQLVTIGNNVTNCATMFGWCTNLSLDNIKFNNVDGSNLNIYGIFSGMNNLKGSISFPDNIPITRYTVLGSSGGGEIGGNVNINIGNAIGVGSDYGSGMFSRIASTGLQGNVTIPDGVTELNCSRFCSNARYLANTYVAGELTNCSYMFANSRVTNVTLNFKGDNVNCTGMFYNCKYLNVPITIPSNAEICATMFYNCRNFNSPVYISAGVTNCKSMFSTCDNFNQDVYVPDSVTDLIDILNSCSNYMSTISVPFIPNFNSANIQYDRQGTPYVPDSDVGIGMKAWTYSDANMGAKIIGRQEGITLQLQHVYLGGLYDHAWVVL